MESLDELKAHLTGYLDERLDGAAKAAVAEGVKDLTSYMDSRFGTLEQGLNDMGGTLSQVSKDVGGVVDSVSKLANTVLAIPTTLAQTVEDTISSTIGRINPFHLP